MTTQPNRPVPFSSLDADLQQLLTGYVAEYVAQRDVEGAAGARKKEAGAHIERLATMETALADGVDVPDPEGTDRVYRVRFVAAGERLDGDTLRENLLTAGVDPDVLNVCWEASMKGSGKKSVRVIEARAK